MCENGNIALQNAPKLGESLVAAKTLEVGNKAPTYGLSF
jgi:hypothetical protein